MTQQIENAQKQLAETRKRCGIDAPLSTDLANSAQGLSSMAGGLGAMVPEQSAPIALAPVLQILPERVKVDPTIARAFLGRDPRNDSRKLASVGRLYYLLRAIDTQGRGKVSLDHARPVITEITGMTRRNLRGIFQQANGLVLDIIDDHIFIYSPARVSIALGAGPLRGRPVYVPLADLCGGIQQVRAALYATYHAGRRKANPIPRGNVRALTGVPERTQIRYDKVAKVKVRYNIGTANEEPTQENYQRRAWEQGRAAFKLFDIKQMKTVIAWRLPNSYDADYEQAPKGRQRKHNRRINLVIKRQQGNDADIVRTYLPTARIAARYASREPGHDHYYPTGTTSTFAADKPTKTKGVDVWALM